MANLLRRSPVNQTCIISLPGRLLEPGRAGAVGSRRESAPVTVRADAMEVPAGDRPSRRRAVLSPRHAEHDADQHQLSSGHVGVDERLGSPRVEETPIVAVAPVFSVEVADAGRRAPRRVRVEPCPRRCARVTPARGCPLQLRPEARRGHPLRRRRQGRRRVLLEVVGRPAQRLGRKRRPAPGLRVEGRAGAGERREHHGDPHAPHRYDCTTAVNTSLIGR